MRFRATGRDRATGEHIEIVFEAANAQAAFASAQQRGIDVEAVNPAGPSQAPAAPPPLAPTQTGQRPPQPHPMPPAEPERPARRQGIRVWAVLVVVAAIIAGIINPTIGYAFTALLAGLILLYFVPGLDVISRGLLGLSPGYPIRTTMKLLFVAFIAFLSSTFAMSSAEAKRMRAEQEVAEAKAAAGNARLTAEADAKVNALVAEGRAKLQAGDVAGAAATLREANGNPHAKAVGQCRGLLNLIERATNKDRVHDQLVALNDADFSAFASNMKVPAAFDLQYPALNQAAISLARPMVAAVQSERVALAKQRAADAEQRRKDELARAETEQKQREADQKQQAERQAQEAAAQAAANKSVQDKVDEFMAVLEKTRWHPS